MDIKSRSRVWFITGISRGLGRALALEVLANGGTVIGTTRSGTVDYLDEMDADDARRLSVLRLDVCDAQMCYQVARMAYDLHKRIDVLVNNAGYGLIGAVEETALVDARDVFETNFWGTTNVTKVFLPYLRNQWHGHIINISSIAGVAPGAGSPFYAAAKFAVEGLSNALAQEIEPLGLKLTVVEPGAFRTEFLGNDSLRHADVRLADYATTSGAARRAFESMDGNQAGDPVLAARAIMSIALVPEPPLHLLLGSDAYKRASAKLDQMQAEMREYADLTMSTDFAGVRQCTPA